MIFYGVKLIVVNILELWGSFYSFRGPTKLKDYMNNSEKIKDLTERLQVAQELIDNAEEERELDSAYGVYIKIQKKLNKLKEGK